MNRFAKILAVVMGIVMFGSLAVCASSVSGLTDFETTSVSATKSVVLPESQTVKIDKETAKITVLLADENGNPVSGHDVRLISSSNNDLVVPFFGSSVSGQNGEVVFEATSKENGLTTYIAFDLTSNTVLDAKAKVVYFDNGNYLFDDSGNSSGPVSKLKFDNVPATVYAGDSMTFNLTALDAQNQTVTDYKGTVKFSINGSNAFYASLPNDYTFTTNDVGAHAFSLASAFKQAGTYNVEVRDTTTPSVYGEYTFIVLPKGSTSGTTQVIGTTSSITITNPVAGTYSNPLQVISGNAKSGAKLKIFDNDLETGFANADSFGAFTYTTGKLADGEHAIYVVSVDDTDAILDKSATVTFSVDTEAPEVSEIVVTPSNSVTPNTKITIKLTSKETLSKATLSFNGNLYEMTDSGKGYYETSLNAPSDNGDYPLLFVVLDQLGNESMIDQKTSVKVSAAGSGDFENLPAASLVGDVSKVTATAYDRKVTLNWEKPVVGGDSVKNYRVYYGVSPNKLTEAVDTFTNSTTWYIANLQNNVLYYFAIIGVDSKGNTSAHFSNIVSATPNSVVSNVSSPEVQMGLAGGEAVAEMPKDPSQAGPEVIWMVVMSAFGGAFYVKSSRFFK
ncbi:MAG: hypothetical protein WC651_01020 [Candidatus Gracilibacteria bacterium]|jgi:hypothetical protein